MGNINIENSNGNMNQPNNPSGGQQPGGGEHADTILTKRNAVRQKLAIALMAVGGTLIAIIAFLSFAKK